MERTENRAATTDASGDRAGAARVGSYGAAPSGASTAATPPHQLAAKDAVQDLFTEARKRGQGVAEKAAEEAQGVAQTLQQRGAQALEEGKTQLADQIHGVAKALRRGGEQLRDDNLSGLAELSEGLAEQAEAVRHYLGERDGEALLHDLQAFARERRALFVGSLFVVGVVAARLMRSSGATSRAESGLSAATDRATVVAKGGVRAYTTPPRATTSRETER